jgi:hypothetical protein
MPGGYLGSVTKTGCVSLSASCGAGLKSLIDIQGILAAFAQRDLLLWRWLAFTQRYPLVVMPTARLRRLAAGDAA